MNALTTTEQTNLEQYEGIIQRGIGTFIEVGEALLAIREQRLYRAEYSTFEDYCRERWGMGKSYSNELIRAAKVVENLAGAPAILPNAVNHVRPLWPLPPDQQREAWQRAVDTAPESGITASHVQRVVDDMTRPQPDPAPRLANHQLIHQSLSPEWYTPARYIEAARRVMGGIDIDPASNDTAQQIIHATTYYTAETNGLDKLWHGRVWLNPPYGDLSSKFIEKLFDEWDQGHIQQAVILVNSHATETLWFRPLWDYLLCFTDHRINFESPTNPGNGSTHGSVFIYMGEHEHEFYNAFNTFGYIVRRVYYD